MTKDQEKSTMMASMEYLVDCYELLHTKYHSGDPTRDNVVADVVEGILKLWRLMEAKEIVYDNLPLHKTFITFGQVHTHSIGFRLYGPLNIAVIFSEDYESGRKAAFEVFGPKWSMAYSEENFDFNYWNLALRNNLDYITGYIRVPLSAHDGDTTC